MYRPTRSATFAFFAAVVTGMTIGGYLTAANASNALTGNPYNQTVLVLAALAFVVGGAVILLAEGSIGRAIFYDAGGPPATQLIARFIDAWRRRAKLVDDQGMSHADQVIWGYADCLPFVGELTAQWLEGKLASQPGYHGPVDTDEEYAPGMTAALAAVNRGGFVTTSSQAGAVTVSDGERWVQHAAVAGFVADDTLATVLKVVEATPGLAIVVCRDPFESFFDPKPVAPVTFRGAPDDRGYPGTPCTDFGGAIPDDVIADEHTGYGVCAPAAVTALQAATQIAVFDIEPDRNDRLWPALLDIADRLPRNWAFRRPAFRSTTD